jgi:hypothetical protein
MNVIVVKHFFFFTGTTPNKLERLSIDQFFQVGQMFKNKTLLYLQYCIREDI